MKLLCDLFGQFYEAWYSPDRSWSGYLSEDRSRILNYRSSLLLCSGLSGFSLSSVFWLIYCTATTSAVLSCIVRRFIQPEVRRMINVQSIYILTIHKSKKLANSLKLKARYPNSLTIATLLSSKALKMKEIFVRTLHHHVEDMLNKNINAELNDCGISNFGVDSKPILQNIRVYSHFDPSPYESTSKAQDDFIWCYILCWENLWFKPYNLRIVKLIDSSPYESILPKTLDEYIWCYVLFRENLWL